MNIYIDFEMSKKAREIISIGAIKENGNTFYSLVRPKYIKAVTPFITDLTGITQEMLLQDDVPILSEMLVSFWNWCCIDCGSVKELRIFSYGSFDKLSLEIAYNKTKLSMLPKIIENMCDLGSVSGLLTFGQKQEFGLKRTLEEIEGKEIEQTHNSLDDAKLLMRLHSYIKDASVEIFMNYEENYYINRYLRAYYKGRMKHRKLKIYLDSLCKLELEQLEYKEIGRLLGYDHLRCKVAKDYWNLTGKDIKGYLYEGK